MKDEIDRILEQWKRQRPDLTPTTSHVAQRIVRLGMLLEAAFEQLFSQHGLSWGEYQVLSALRRAGPPHRMSPTALYCELILSSGGMTKRVDRLERCGFVERQADPNDRRGRLVALTKKGKDMADRAVVDLLKGQDRLFGALSSTERRQLVTLLRKLLLSEPFVALKPAQPAERR